VREPAPSKARDDKVAARWLSATAIEFRERLRTKNSKDQRGGDDFIAKITITV